MSGYTVMGLKKYYVTKDKRNLSDILEEKYD